MPRLLSQEEKQLAQAVDQVRLELAKQVIEMRKAGASTDEILKVLSDLDMEDFVFNRLGLKGDMDAFAVAWEQTLSNMKFTGAITEETLIALTEMGQTTLAQNIGSMFHQSKTQLAKGVLSGASERAIADGLKDTIRADHAQTVANTLLNTYERQVSSVMAENDPPNSKYIYVGAVDDRTRDICLDMIQAGEMTREEISNRFGDSAFVDGGGYNCRHAFQRVTESTTKDKNESKAKDKIKEKKNFNPIPFAERVAQYGS